MKDIGMESQETTSKTSLLNSMILKAWSERWTDAQWGINIKTVIPRGVSGDAHNLADCILQQGLIGSNANPLVISYLKHSLCAHLVSHAAVLKRISTYEHFEKVFCCATLLEFLESIIDGITCRSKPEEAILPGAVVSLVYWLTQIIAVCIRSYEIKGDLCSEQQLMIEFSSKVLDKISKNDFLLAIFYVGKQEDHELFSKIGTKYRQIKMLLLSSGYIPKHPNIETIIHELSRFEINQLKMLELNSFYVESITHCVQPLLAIEVFLNPSSDTKNYVTQMLMIQRLKNFSTARLFYEIIRAGFISLHNASETTHDTMWAAFTFFKIPDILKQLHSKLSDSNDSNLDHIPDVVKAIGMLIKDTSVLDFMDSKCLCNTVEHILNDWANQHLVSETHIKEFSSKREQVSQLIQNREFNQSSSIINYVLKAEVPLSGILKTLSADYNKVQESLLGVLGQTLVGNSFELVLSVATVEGRLKTFVSRLIKCNENSKQIPGEVGKAASVRLTLFDISFLMLTSIVQKYGPEAVLSENGDSFFEKWVRECMFDKNKIKAPRNMTALCEENIVDELLLNLSKPEAQVKTNTLTWQDICMNIPGVLYQVLIAWENETISSADVKGILDRMKRRLFSFSVCAASYLCAYMQTVPEDEYLKPLNMIQQFLSTLATEEMSTQDNIKERLGLTFQIIRKMQHDAHPAGNAKLRNLSLTQNIISSNPLVSQFKDEWMEIIDIGWLKMHSAQVLESLLHSGGSTWFVFRLIEEIVKCKYTKDMMKTVDLIFGIMHLDLEKTTLALLESVVPMIFFNRTDEIFEEPQSFMLARLCVYCIIANLESPQTSIKKRHRNGDTDELNAAKIRKMNQETSDISNAVEFIHENANLPDDSLNIQEPLQSSIQFLFKIFSNYLSTDELSPRIYFIYQFISLLVECGKDRIMCILKLLPNNFIQSLLKVVVTDEIKVGLITRLYDLRLNTGRLSAVSDLCLLRNINMRKQGIQL